MFEFSAWAQELPTRTYKAHSVSIALQVRNDVIDKGNAVVMKKEEVSSTGLVFPHAQRCYWLDIGHWKRTDPGVGWATWGVPLNTSHLGDSSSRTKQAPRSTPGCGGAWLNRQSEGGPPQEPCISSEQTFHWSRDGGIQEQKQLAMPRSRNMYWYLVSFLQLFYLNIPRFSIHFRNRWLPPIPI